MRQGDTATAWRISDAVLAGRDPAARDDPRVPYYRRWVWDGTPPDGRDVLVRCYHGLGDVLMFARFLPALVARTRSVLVEAPATLLSLLSTLAPSAAFDPARPLPPSECDIEIMELSHALRLRLDEVPAAWLTPPPIRGCDTLALCWTAGDWRPARSVPLPALLDALPDGRLVSLQRGAAAAEADDPRFINPSDGDRDVVRSARLAAASRAVVTVDTAVAHLAGCLGLPTWLLLDAEPDWRWGCGAGACPWYPGLQMLRQDRPGDWSGPLRALQAALQAARLDAVRPLRYTPACLSHRSPMT